MKNLKSILIVGFIGLALATTGFVFAHGGPGGGFGWRHMGGSGGYGGHMGGPGYGMQGQESGKGFYMRDQVWTARVDVLGELSGKRRNA